MLQNGDATITVVGDPTAGIIRISIANAKTAQLEFGRYMNALQLTIGDIVSPLWLSVSLLPPTRGARCCRHEAGPREPYYDGFVSICGL